MSQITIIEKLTPSQKNFVNLRIGHKSIKELGDIQSKRKISEILTKASFDMNSPMADDAKMLQFQTEGCYNELCGKYSSLTLPEVNEAFKMGIRGEFGAYFGMCPKTYHQFVKGFWDLKDRTESWLAYLKMVEDENTSNKPVVFTKEYLTKVANNALEDYKRDGSMPLIPHAIYDTIKEINSVETLILKEDWQRIKEEAKENYLLKMNPKKKKGIADMLDFGITYEFEVKKVALRYYFERSK